MNKALRIVLHFLALMVCISIVTFCLAYISPVNPIDAFFGVDSSVSDAQKEILRHNWALDVPPVQRFFQWVLKALKLDFGTSYLYQQPVLKIIKEGFLNSCLLMTSSWLLSGIIGAVLGIICAYNAERTADRLIKSSCFVLTSIPSFWFGIVMLFVFSVKFKLFPIGLSAPIGMTAREATFPQLLYHAFLPSLTLSITGIPNIVIYTRDAMLESLESDYAVFAFSRGITKTQFFFKHGFRNIIKTVITLQTASINEIFGGSVLVENVFTYAGLGSLAVEAGIKGDMPLLMGITIISALVVFAGNMLANILYPYIDPRVEKK